MTSAENPNNSQTKSRQSVIVENALRLSEDTGSDKVFLFLNSEQGLNDFLQSPFADRDQIVLVVPSSLDHLIRTSEPIQVVRNWSGNQSRFSRIKYTFLQAVLQGVISMDTKVVCILGPFDKDHLDTITIHDLALSWSEEFPFDPHTLITKRFFLTVMAVVDVALDIGALGREGKSVGTTFIVGNINQIMRVSHQAVFNPFNGYPKESRCITSPEVVESIKELAKIDGAFVIAEDGTVEAAGRHLDAVSTMTRQLKGFGSRHRAAMGITLQTEAVAIVVSESTGRVTIFDQGAAIASLEPVISRRVV